MKKPISAESNFNITSNERNKSQTINLWNFKLEGSYKNGKGKEYDEYGRLIYEGEYLNGKRHGKGKEYNEYGNLTFVGEYLNGKKMEKEKNIMLLAT